MCQCVACDCWWCNFCGICCAGWHWAYCCLGCWVCKPVEMSNPACCQCCTCTGCGHNFFFYGGVCCAPDYVKDYSRLMNGDGGNVIVVNTNTPLVATTNYWSLYHIIYCDSIKDYYISISYNLFTFYFDIIDFNIFNIFCLKSYLFQQISFMLYLFIVSINSILILVVILILLLKIIYFYFYISIII